MTVVTSKKEHTLPSFDVCAETAAKGVCSGSAESISRSCMARSAYYRFCSHSRKQSDGGWCNEEVRILGGTNATSGLDVRWHLER